MSDPIERYLAELTRALPRLGRRRILAEAEDHLRDSALAVGEEEAVQRFGPARDFARSFRERASLRLAGVALLVVLAFPILTYPIGENGLPPAPWPEADAMPAHLAALKAAVSVLFLTGFVAVILGLRLHSRALLSFGAAALAAMSGTGIALALEWKESVPATPGWLFVLPASQAALAVGAIALLVRSQRGLLRRQGL